MGGGREGKRELKITVRGRREKREREGGREERRGYGAMNDIF